MLTLKVHMATATFHKYWMDRWMTFVKSSDSTDLFATMLSQTRRVFKIAIEAEVLFKNFQKKNKEFFNKTS